MVFPVVFPMSLFSYDEERSHEDEPLTWRGAMRKAVAYLVSLMAPILLIHYFIVPNPAIGRLENLLTWYENVNAVTVRGFDGSESYVLSGNCYVGDGSKYVDGRSHPGPASIRCYDGDYTFSYRVLDGMSFTVESTGGSYGWEESRATIRVAGSTVVYGLSEYNGRDNG